MRVLMTGATGFLGSHLLHRLLEKGNQVVVLKRSSSSLDRILDVVNECNTYDIDKISLPSIFQQEAIDVVIHCATIYGADEEKVFEANFEMPLKLLRQSIQYGCKYFINTDTFYCKQLPERLLKGRPLYKPEYTMSKYLFREWGKACAIEGRINFLNLQMEHIYGPDDNPNKFIPWIEQQLSADVKTIDLTDGIQIRDFLPVNKAVNAYLEILGKLSTFSGYYSCEVGTGISCSLKQFLEKRRTELNSKTELKFGALPRTNTEIMYSTALKNL